MTKVQQNHLHSFNNTLIVLKHALFMHPFSCLGDFRGVSLFVFQKGTNACYRPQKNIISLIEQ